MTTEIRKNLNKHEMILEHYKAILNDNKLKKSTENNVN
jgi:hypothetical protein